MVGQTVFTERYNVGDGQSWSSVMASKRRAREAALASFNKWRDAHRAAQVISVETTSFESLNSDESPFWVELTVTYEEMP